jgi:hypothetical protein
VARDDVETVCHAAEGALVASWVIGEVIAAKGGGRVRFAER